MCSCYNKEEIFLEHKISILERFLKYRVTLKSGGIAENSALLSQELIKF